MHGDIVGTWVKVHGDMGEGPWGHVDTWQQVTEARMHGDMGMWGCGDMGEGPWGHG